MNFMRVFKILSHNPSKLHNLPKFSRYCSSVSSKAAQNHVYTEAEIEEIKKAFRSLPSYQLTESIGREDIPKIFQVMNLPRTQKQLEEGDAFVQKFCGGRLTLEDLVHLVQTEHDPLQHLIYIGKMIDTNQDGFISAEEYKIGVELMKTWYPTSKIQNLKIDYEQFVKEADTNKDGRVSVEELQTWLVQNV